MNDPVYEGRAGSWSSRNKLSRAHSECLQSVDGGRYRVNKKSTERCGIATIDTSYNAKKVYACVQDQEGNRKWQGFHAIDSDHPKWGGWNGEWAFDEDGHTYHTSAKANNTLSNNCTFDDPVDHGDNGYAPKNLSYYNPTCSSKEKLEYEKIIYKYSGETYSQLEHGGMTTITTDKRILTVRQENVCPSGTDAIPECASILDSFEFQSYSLPQYCYVTHDDRAKHCCTEEGQRLSSEGVACVSHGVYNVLAVSDPKWSPE